MVSLLLDKGADPFATDRYVAHAREQTPVLARSTNSAQDDACTSAVRKRRARWPPPWRALLRLLSCVGGGAFARTCSLAPGVPCAVLCVLGSMGLCAVCGVQVWAQCDTTGGCDAA
jgi:hypothetical protein